MTREDFVKGRPFKLKGYPYDIYRAESELRIMLGTACVCNIAHIGQKEFYWEWFVLDKRVTGSIHFSDLIAQP